MILKEINTQMSELKYFFIWDLKPINSFCKCTSLKRGCIFSNFLFVFTETILFLIDLFKSTDGIIIIIIRHFIFSVLNFISFVKYVKSLFQFDYKQAYFGYLSFTLCILLHFALFIINIVFNLHISSLYFPYFDFTIPNYPSNFFSYSIPNLLFLFLEIAASFICFSYTKHLSMGRDALVDGQSFDKYFVDLGSDNSSFHNNDNSSNKEQNFFERKISESNIFNLGFNFFSRRNNQENKQEDKVNEMKDKMSISPASSNSIDNSFSSNIENLKEEKSDISSHEI